MTSLQQGGQGFSLFSFYTSLSGRASRKQYWLLFVVPYVVLLVAATLIDGAMLSASLDADIMDETMAMPLPMATLAALLLTIWPAIALAVRRLHDRGRSGWLYLLLMVPFANLWIFIEILFLRGKDGDNVYGPDPLVP